MPFDFPNSPSIGQRVTGVGGIVYVWDGVKWTNSVGGVTVQSMGDVGRNLIHNPLFNVTQRGGGPWTTGGMTADRWFVNLTAGSLSTSINGLPDASRAQIGDESAVLGLTGVCVGGAGANDETTFEQRMESVRRTSGKTVTLSFWAIATSGTPKLGTMIYQAFGSGGSPSGAVVVAGSAVTLSTTYTRYSVSFSLPSTAGKTFGTTAGTDYLGVRLAMSAGTTVGANYGNPGVQSATFQLWGVQLEVGSVATPLEKPDPRYDLANCQRFYQVVKASARFPAVNAGQVSENAVYFHWMRTVPTITAGAADGSANISGAVLNPLAMPNCARFGITSAGAGDAYGIGYLFTLSADL